MTTTSAQAYARIEPHLPSILEQVYQFILAQGLRGATAWEVEQGLRLSGSTVRPRLITLRGLDKKSPKPARITTMGEMRETGSGSNALAWIAVEKPNG